MDWLQDALLPLWTRAASLPELLVSPDSRLFYGYLGSALLLAAVSYGQLAPRRSRSVGSFVRFVVPAQVYRHRSFWLDVQIILFNHVLVPFEWIMQGLTLSYATEQAAEAWRWVIPSPLVSGTWSAAQRILLGVGLFVIYDFARFICHWLHHKVGFLWRFHSVHHSAEHLNPLTTLRFHPLELLLESISVVVLLGFFAGFATSALGADPLPCFEWVLTWFYLRAFTLLGATLRHTHVWISWGPFFSRLFISPAQHQIHHSTASHHLDRNFGVCLSLWDWLFGTLYIPRAREQITFGVADGQPHLSLRSALLRPLSECLTAVQEGIALTRRSLRRTAD